MANPEGPPAAQQDAPTPNGRSMFWMVFWAVLAALIVMEVIEGVIDYLV